MPGDPTSSRAASWSILARRVERAQAIVRHPDVMSHQLEQETEGGCGITIVVEDKHLASMCERTCDNGVVFRFSPLWREREPHRDSVPRSGPAL
jgi:hypothetical protein